MMPTERVLQVYVPAGILLRGVLLSPAKVILFKASPSTRGTLQRRHMELVLLFILLFGLRFATSQTQHRRGYIRIYPKRNVSRL